MHHAHHVCECEQRRHFILYRQSHSLRLDKRAMRTAWVCEAWVTNRYRSGIKKKVHNTVALQYRYRTVEVLRRYVVQRLRLCDDADVNHLSEWAVAIRAKLTQLVSTWSDALQNASSQTIWIRVGRWLI